MEAPRIHPDTIEAVRQRADIVDVISDRVVLRKRGKDHTGLCPFHEEKSPSFSVSPSKQLYYCFGCGAGGNVYKFLMELDKRSFSDVVLDLARRYQVPVQTIEPQERQELQRQLSLREQLYELVSLAARFYQHALHQPGGQAALDYLLQKRQLAPETIQQFQLGYAPAGWDTLYRYLVEQKKYSVALVEQAGLIQQRKSGSGYYDRFRNRLTIPISDGQGRIIGFGSRTLTNEEPKYLNSPETPLFDKSKTLFALDKAKQAISKNDRAVVVEGYFDAIALHAAGIEQAVASLGTAFTQDQLRLLLRYTDSKQAILNFDADKAGIAATQRAIGDLETLVYSGQVQLRVLNLPGGKDADEFLKSAPNAPEVYQRLLEAAPLWLDWQIEKMLASEDISQGDRFQVVAASMVKLIARLDDANQRAHYIRFCAEKLSQGNSRLVALYSDNLLSEIKRRRARVRSKTKPAPAGNALQPNLQPNAENALLERAESLLLRVYLHCPRFRKEIDNLLEEKELIFSLSSHRFLWQIISEVNRDADFLARLQDRANQEPDRAAALAPLFVLNETRAREIDRPGLVVRAAIATMEQVACEKHKQYCLEQWQKLDPATESDRREYYYKEFYEAQHRALELRRQRQFSLHEILEIPAS